MQRRRVLAKNSAEKAQYALRGWRNTAGSLIEILWLKKAYDGPHVTGNYMHGKQRGTVSSNSRVQTVLLQQYFLNLSARSGIVKLPNVYICITYIYIYIYVIRSVCVYIYIYIIKNIYIYIYMCIEAAPHEPRADGLVASEEDRVERDVARL